MESKEKNFTMEDLEHAKVRVAQGWLQGYTEEARNGGILKIFKGIPFAAPPVGELRFRHPVSPGSWRGIRQATQYGPAAIQPVQESGDAAANVHGVPQMLAPSQYQEDCLYLNVWTPAKTQADKLPVFIWVHGGGMVAGSGVECVCAGEGLAGRKDMIVVTINYRLGLFGWFAHAELTREGNGTSGNYGLYDIRQACIWVKENIAAFGGDPENITLAGQSGGARATCACLASPLMKGLVQHIIVESGAMAFGGGAPAPRADVEAVCREFMQLAGASSISELRSMDAWELFDIYQSMAKRESRWNKIKFCIDGEFLPRNYYDMLADGEINDFDVMVGSCAQEAPCNHGKGLDMAVYESHVKRLFPDAWQKMLQWYPASNPVEAEKACSSIASDIMAANAVYVAKMCCKHGKHAYLWMIAKENETQKGHDLGCPHCAEMPYVFGRVDTGDRDPFYPYHWVGADYDFMELIQDYWYNFAKTGNPNCAGCPKWRIYSRDYDICLLENHTHMLSEEESAGKRYLFDKILQEGRDTQVYGLSGAGSTFHWVQASQEREESK